jgi:ribose 5-phosphate isomerase B
MKIFIGTDHAGYELKEKLKTYLSNLGLGYEVIDKGAFSYDANDDYPDFSKAVAQAVQADTESRGIILGGSGQGEAMAANRIPGVRVAVFYGPREAVHEVEISGRQSSDSFEIIKLAREHNDANVLCLGVRFLSEDEAKFAIELFLSSKFSGTERHVRRIAKI